MKTLLRAGVGGERNEVNKECTRVIGKRAWFQESSRFVLSFQIMSAFQISLSLTQTRGKWA